MPKLNENYQNVEDSYLFAEIARRVKVYEETHPDKADQIIRLGIGECNSSTYEERDRGTS